MSERSVSDLVFRDLDAPVPRRRFDAEREAALRRELEKLHAQPAPRVVPAGARPSAQQRPQ